MLKKDYFTTDETKEKYGDKKFNDLSPEEKVLFWKYEVGRSALEYSHLGCK